MTDARVEAALALAKECLRSAGDDLIDDRLHRAASSLYFAVFDAARAALIPLDVEASKHTHVRAEFNRRLVREGMVSGAEADVYNELFDLRLRTDYDLEADLSREEVEEQVEVARRLVATLSDLARVT